MSYFQFKKFRIEQNLTAMKVGTDGVLIGAWADNINPKDNKRMLDIGTGTGLIAIMLAQRFNESLIDAIEIDKDACEQASQNFANCQWDQRISLINCDFKQFSIRNDVDKYDLIVSNPPYFNQSYCPEDTKRTIARQTNLLNYQDLIKGVSNLLLPDGVFAVILPSLSVPEFTTYAQRQGLYPQRKLWIQTTVGKDFKRCMLTFSTHQSECEETSILIELARHQYSAAYIELTKDFYLNL